MLSNSTKRRPPSQPTPTSPTSIANRLLRLQDDNEKEDDELDLEASLFGKKRKRARAVKKKNKGKAVGQGDEDMPGVVWEDRGELGQEGSELGLEDADEVSLLEDFSLHPESQPSEDVDSNSGSVRSTCRCSSSTHQ